jgi:hypothetical protein
LAEETGKAFKKDKKLLKGEGMSLLPTAKIFAQFDLVS